MTRGLSGSEITVLEGQQYISEECIKLVTGTGVTYRYTTGRNSTVLPDGTYIPQSYISTVTNVVESYEIRPAEISIVFETFNATFLSDIDNSSYLKSTVVVYKVFKDPTLFSVSGQFSMFSGTVTGLDLVGGRETQSLTLRCTSLFNNFSRSRGRLTSDIGYTPPRAQIYWGKNFQ